MARKSGTYYEILSREVFESIANQNRVKTIDVLHNQKLQGKTTKHQIDVYWEFEDSGITYRNVVQVKDWGGSVTKGEMLKFLKVVEDLPNQPRGIFVSRNGYQKGAREVAEKHGILMYKLHVVDSEKSSVEVMLQVTSFGHNTTNYIMHFDPEWMNAECKRLGIPYPKPTKVEFYPAKLNFFDENGNIVANLHEIVDSYYPKEPKNVKETRCHHEFKEPTFMDSGVPELPRYKVSAVDFMISAKKRVELRPMVLTSVVEFILENVLEKSERRFDRHFKPKTSRG